MYFSHTNSRRLPMEKEKNQKNEGNNQWTNSNVEKIKDDDRKRKDGPGGN